MDSRCRVCSCGLRGESVEYGVCYRCRTRSKIVSICPVCKGGTMPKFLHKHGTCRTCFDMRMKESRELTASEREHALKEFAQWLDTTSSAWQRAIGGLRMFVPDDGTGHWP